VSFKTRKQRLTWLLCAILVVCFLGTSVLGFYIATDAVRDDIIKNGLPLTSNTVYSEVKSELLRPISISEQMAANTFLHEWVQDGERDSNRLLGYLRKIKKQFATDKTHFVSDLSRRYYDPVKPPQILRANDPRDAWFFRIRSSTQPYTLDVKANFENLDKLMILVNFRLTDDQGRFLGLTGIGVTLDSLSELLENIEKQFERRVYFTDTNGKVVLANKQYLKSRGSLSAPASLPNPNMALNKQAKFTISSYQRDKAMVLVHSRYIPELQLFLVVEQNEEHAIAPFIRLLVPHLVFGGIMTLAALGLTILAVNQSQAQLEQIATKDALTDAINRATGEAMLEQVCKDAIRNQHPLCVVIFDIDNFKSINDTHGHAAGDVVIRGVARLASESVRASDTLVRWGGEEFLMFFKDCPSEQAFVRAEDIRKRIASYDFSLNQPITVSLGLAHFLPPESGSALTKRADDALYIAKNRGKNRVERASGTQPA
jgi:diguanylate cyclase (GGDEF)-like protein